VSFKDVAVMLQLSSLAVGQEIFVRMGTSFISPDQACANAEGEIPKFDFFSVSQSAIEQFEAILNRIRVDDTNVPSDTLTLFYSSV
jgi:putative alpha-1,2-mannosidase